jgi:hypothetical protein
MLRRLQAGLAVRQTQTTFEVLGLGRNNALLRISLTRENNIHYAQFVKRQNEMQSGVKGRKPALSIEITRECRLRCPGCYACEDNHISSRVDLRQLLDKKGDSRAPG